MEPSAAAEGHQNHPLQRGPGRRVTGAGLLLVALVIGITLMVVWIGRGPATPGGVGPISTGSLVMPSGPGQTAVVSADSVPFQRPTVEYVGLAPWQIQSLPRGTKVLEGYASRPSYLPGQTLRIAISTSSPTFDVTLWRVSGQPPDTPFHRMADVTGVRGRLQSPPTIDPQTLLVSAAWVDSWAFPIPANWPSGVYLARLAGSEGVQSYVPFIVRSAAPHAVLVVSSALDWQAYNDWGGASLYVTRVGEPMPGVSRAVAVSFNRPYTQDGGAGQLFMLELPFLAWLDRQGFDVSYTTDYDLSIGPDAQPLPRVIVFNGHSEYWGAPLYDWLDYHVNSVGDLGLALLAADTGYWPVSFDQPAAADPRSFTSLKGGPVPAALLPPGQTPEPSEPAGATPPPGDIEERSGTGIEALGINGPYLGAFADQPVFGVRYRGITSALGRYTILQGGADPRLLAGTGLASGDSLGFIAGGEVDGVDPGTEWSGPLGGAGDHVFAEAAQIPGLAGLRWTAQAVWRELPSGGRVFSASTFYWGWALDPTWGGPRQVPAGFDQLTINILRFLGAR